MEKDLFEISVEITKAILWFGLGGILRPFWASW